MRWESLFDDLEGQLEQELDAEELELRAEEERLRIGRMSLRDRIIAATGPGSAEVLRLELTDGSVLEVRMTAYGRDWIAGDAAGQLARRGPVIVPLWGIAAIGLRADQVEQSLAAAPATPAPLADRLGFAFVLRTVCRRRTAVELALRGGRLHGTLDRVGRDHLDLAVHDPGTQRRADVVRQVRIVPFAQVLLVRI